MRGVRGVPGRQPSARAVQAPGFWLLTPLSEILELTAWGFAGVFGPLLIAGIRQSTGKYDQVLVVIALIMLVSSVLPLIVRTHRVERQPAGARERG